MLGLRVIFGSCRWGSKRLFHRQNGTLPGVCCIAQFHIVPFRSNKRKL
jgi:hypothetical protein